MFSNGVLRRELICGSTLLFSDHFKSLIIMTQLLLFDFRNSQFFSQMAISLSELGRLYLVQLVKGCKDENCCNMNCARNNTSILCIYALLKLVSDKNVAASRAILLAKNGTCFSCTYVNRCFHCDDETLKEYIPQSFFENKEAAQKLLKCAMELLLI